MDNKLIKQLLLAIPIGAFVGFLIGKISMTLFPDIDMNPFMGILFILIIVNVNNRKKLKISLIKILNKD